MSKERGRPPHDDVLTPAEWRTVEWVRHGLTNRDIARRQAISADAVKYHVANVLQKLGYASRADLRRWDGVRRDSHLFSKEKDVEDPVKVGPIGQIARHVKDVAAASHWYGDILGLDHLYTFGNLAFYDCGGVRLMLSEGEGGGEESLVYFKVADVRTACATLTERGVAFANAPHMIHRHADGTEEWMAFFTDNEGRPLAIMSQARP